MHPGGYTPLHRALQLGCSHPIGDWKGVTELLLKKGANLNTRVKHIYDHESITLLHAAARADVNAERVTFLLDKGADVDELDNEGRTALHHAAQNGEVEVIKVLLDRGAEIDALDKDNRTPLHFAATERRTGAVKLLLQRGAKPNIEDRYGSTPLYSAIVGNAGMPLMGNQDLIDALVKAAPECVHLKNKYGETPFELARSCANEYIFEYVQDAANKFGVKNEKPLDAAMGENLPSMQQPKENKKPLTEKVEDPSARAGSTFRALANVKNEEGRTSLHIAAQENNVGIVQFLINHGVDANIKDNKGQIPLDIARERWGDNMPITKLLIQHTNQEENSKKPLDAASASMKEPDTQVDNTQEERHISGKRKSI